MAWTQIGSQLGKTYALATEGGKNKYGSPTILAHIIYTRVNFDNLNGTFQPGDTITGGTSEETAVVQFVHDGYLLVSQISGALQDDEQITGSESEATADVDGAPVDGEPKVETVDTSTLAMARVLVTDAGADEDLVNGRMAVYTT